MFVSALDYYSNEEFPSNNDFSRDFSFRAVTDCKATLPKAVNELPVGQEYA